MNDREKNKENNIVYIQYMFIMQYETCIILGTVKAGTHRIWNFMNILNS